MRKGASMRQLRLWQERAIERFLRTTEDFLAVACPGAGKTTFALTAAREAIDRGEARRVIVVVPTSHLRKQWAEAAVSFGLRLDHAFENGSGVIANDMDGVVVTYQAVASAPHLYRMLSTRAESLVILDEIHHGGDTLSWGAALRSAFELATRRLLLSGTPTRTDRKPVPFVKYDENGMFVAGYEYGYGAAIQDHAVRPIEFRALNGDMRWRAAGQVMNVSLADADDTTLTHALRTALQHDGDWIRSVLEQADQELTRHRLSVPDAGGLVVASTQHDAVRYAEVLGRISGESPAVAISEDPKASDHIKKFTASSTRWLVAVQMVSEGVDIPRLAVGVYATNIRDSEMFFRQVVGRFVRMRGDDDETTATLLIPSVYPLLRYAETVEQVVNAALKHEEEVVRREVEQSELPGMGFDFDPLGSSGGEHYATILAGDSFTDDELRMAEALARQVGMPASVSVSQVARLLRLSGGGVATAVPVAAPVVPLAPADEKKQLRRVIKKKVARLHALTGTEYSHIHQRLNERFGDRIDTATADTLLGRLDLLEEFISREV
jgi:superfamily II DNA or RNA helicase